MRAICVHCKTSFDVPERLDRDMDVLCESCASKLGRGASIDSLMSKLGVPQKLIDHLPLTDWSALRVAEGEIKMWGALMGDGIAAIYIYGAVGVGKSHLAALILREYLTHQIREFWRPPDTLAHGCRWIGADTLAFELAYVDAPSTDIAIVRSAMGVANLPRLIVLDDVLASPAETINKVAELITMYRLEHKLPMIITSNFAPNRLDPRIYSRLKADSCLIVHKTGKDMRSERGLP